MAFWDFLGPHPHLGGTFWTRAWVWKVKTRKLTAKHEAAHEKRLHFSGAWDNEKGIKEDILFR